jgi:MraZ protein
MDPATRRVQRLLLGHAVDMNLDSAGRILVPDLLREYAQMERDVMLVGQGNKIEFWSADVWQAQRMQWIETTRAQAADEAMGVTPLSGLSL